MHNKSTIINHSITNSTKYTLLLHNGMVHTITVHNGMTLAKHFYSNVFDLISH